MFTSTTSLTPQGKAVLQHLLEGKTISARQAFDLYGIQNLTARLADIRELGITLQKTYTYEKDIKICHWQIRYKNDAYVTFRRIPMRILNAVHDEDGEFIGYKVTDGVTQSYVQGNVLQPLYM